MKRIIIFFIVLFFISTSLLVFAEENDKNKDVIKLTPETGWMLSGSIRSRYEWWDWFDPGTKGGTTQNNNYPFFSQLTKIKAVNEKKYTDTTLEIAVPSFFFLPNNTVGPPPLSVYGLGATYKLINRGNFASIFLKQGNINFKNLLGKNISAKLGRFEWYDGAEYFTGDSTIDWLKKNRTGQRLIVANGFAQVQRSFDGFHIVEDNPYFNTTIVGAKPTFGVYDLQGNREVSDVDFLYASITPKAPSKDLDARVFYLLYNDDRSLLKADNRPLNILRRDTQDILLNTFGGHIIKKIGPVDLVGWGTLQYGDWGKQRNRGWAYDIEAGYQPKDFFMKPWFRIGRTRTSGDSNPRDGVHETYFPMLQTARIFTRFPFYNTMNIKDNFAQLMFTPRKKMTVSLEFHNLRLAEPNDLWYTGAGAINNSYFGYFARPSNSKRTLANYFDISFDYKISKCLDFTYYLGHAIGEGVIRSLFPGRRGNFMYWELIRYF